MDRKKVYLFIDESGDASFYAKGNKLLVGTEGFQPLLLLGLIVLEDKKEIYTKVKSLQDEIKNDSLYHNLNPNYALGLIRAIKTPLSKFYLQ